jgi:UDP-N-acetylmuramyl pentapeptide phosphotransferase/UDP-N-acetylglucosamine-1-phosphate transferase
MENIIFSCALAFLITLFSIPVIIEVAKDKKLFDVPGGRKVHKVVIPTLGGLGIFAGFIIGTLLGVPASDSSVLQYFAAAIMIIFFMGIKDDILILTATKKFVGQLIAAGVIIKFGGIEINNFYGLLGVHEIPHTASFLISLFAIVVITNSFNLIDGVDGLAGSLGLLTSIIFGLYFYLSGELLYAVIAWSLAGSLVGFLIYNFSPAKIFMGDTGSLLIGLVNSILVIKFINIASNPGGAIPLPSAPALGFSILVIPLFDTLRVVSVRIIHRRSPFWPDRNHIHHFLLDMGLSHKAIALLLPTTNLLLVLMAYILRFEGSLVVFTALAGTSIVSVALIKYNKPRQKIMVTNGHLHEEPVLGTHKILTITEPLEQN